MKKLIGELFNVLDNTDLQLNEKLDIIKEQYALYSKEENHTLYFHSHNSFYELLYKLLDVKRCETILLEDHNHGRLIFEFLNNNIDNFNLSLNYGIIIDGSYNISTLQYELYDKLDKLAYKTNKSIADSCGIDDLESYDKGVLMPFIYDDDRLLLLDYFRKLNQNGKLIVIVSSKVLVSNNERISNIRKRLFKFINKTGVEVESVISLPNNTISIGDADLSILVFTKTDKKEGTLLINAGDYIDKTCKNDSFPIFDINKLIKNYHGNIRQYYTNEEEFLHRKEPLIYRTLGDISRIDGE